MKCLASFRQSLLLGAAVAFCAGSAFAADFRIVAIDGTVRIAEPGSNPAPAKLNQMLPTGTSVTTAAGGRVTLNNGAQNIVVGPNSRMTVAPESGGFVRIAQDLGAVLFQVDKQQKPHFRVDTPLLAAVVKGTTFTVVVDPQMDSVNVAEGLVEVRSNMNDFGADVAGGSTGAVQRDAPSSVNVTTPAAAGGDIAAPPMPAAALTPIDYNAVSNGLVDTGPAPAMAAGAVQAFAAAPQAEAPTDPVGVNATVTAAFTPEGGGGGGERGQPMTQAVSLASLAPRPEIPDGGAKGGNLAVANNGGPGLGGMDNGRADEPKGRDNGNENGNDRGPDLAGNGNGKADEPKGTDNGNGNDRGQDLAGNGKGDEPKDRDNGNGNSGNGNAQAASNGNSGSGNANGNTGIVETVVNTVGGVVEGVNGNSNSGSGNSGSGNSGSGSANSGSGNSNNPGVVETAANTVGGLLDAVTGNGNSGSGNGNSGSGSSNSGNGNGGGKGLLGGLLN